MRRPWSTLALAGLALAGMAPASARAQAFDAYLAAGYSVIRATTLPGTFAGCRKEQSLTFADGSRFTCSRKTAQGGTMLPVRILRSDAGLAVLIGDRPYAGSLVQLGQSRFRRPLSVGADLPVDPQVAASPHLIERIQPVQSVGQLLAGSSRRLNDAQPDPLPPRTPPGQRNKPLQDR